MRLWIFFICPAVSSSAEDLGPESLWDEAYSALRKKDSKLIDAYERALLASNDEHQQDVKRTLPNAGQISSVGGIDRAAQLQKLVDCKLQDINNSRIKITVSGKEVVVKDQVRKIVTAILSAKDFIGSVVSSEPHAALAWAGVLIALPVLLNPVTQDDDAMKGLAYISDLLVRWKVTEDTYLKPQTIVASIPGQSTSQPLRDLRTSFRAKTIELYSQILKYQIQLAQQYSRSGMFRLLRDFIENRITKDLSAFNSNTLKVVRDKVIELQGRAEKSLALLMETKADVENISHTQLLGKLPRAEYAAFNTFKKNEPPPPECLDGTRVDILNQIQDWGEGRGSKCIFWLKGMAGTGKSTIARTISHRFHEKGRLGTSFFFSKGKKDLGDATAFFTTLAVQLTEVLPDLKRHVCDAIAKRGDIGQQSLLNQWKYLILQPLLALDKGLLLPIVLVFVIDALDECESDYDLPMILRLLTEVKDLKIIRIRVFITSRPETPIRLGFREIPEITHHDLMLHSIPQLVIEHDISVFLRHELLKISKKRSLGKDWPGEEDIQKLVQKAGRLFIYAATACRFLNKSIYPKKRLSEMFQVNSASRSSTRELDEMYMMVLKNLITKGHDEDNEDVTRLFREIVGSIIILFETLSVVALTRLLAISSTEVNETLEPLRSVLNIPDDETSPIQLFHLSFRDFLLDTQRCTDSRFWIDEKTAHSKLSMHCLKLMSEHLRRDMCDLRLIGALASEVEKSKIEKYIPLDVQYACSYWVSHLQRSDIVLCDNGQVHRFLNEHFLHWLETLSHIRKIFEGVLRVIDLSKHLSTLPPGEHTELRAMIHDAERFILNYKSVINLAPLQVYNSALIFSPAKSIIKNLFLNEASTWIKRSSCAVAFSPDGQLLASVSDDNTIRLWDINTGALHSVLEGHSGSAIAVAFSPDGQLLASGSIDNTVRLWDTNTNASHGTLEGHTTPIWAVAFSPNKQFAISRSYNEIIRLWDPTTGALCGTLKGHLVEFSPDGLILASISSDRTIRLWDLKTEALISTLRGHSNSVNALAFSPDGQLLASASSDKTIMFWDPKTGSPRGTLRGHSKSINTVIFSPNCKLLASASDDRTVRLWDVNTGALSGILNGHSSQVDAVTFLPDGQLLASASFDNTVRLWNTKTKEMIQKLNTKDWIMELFFARDGSHLITNRGILELNLSTLCGRQPELKSSSYLYVDQHWVTYNEENVLWLPPDYRANSLPVQDNILALGHTSGRMTFLDFNLHSIPLR
ncbi:hypothetical protein G7Y89_g6154 [Cudoniella acicularis]|uniref:Uncharacterized protein n=1 Tax=Cudoniella acicularis TaxID=354080 RepID=A0A8H4W2Q4_9HELO|nr:hypothetical protein G7Y89_g6154 [Cudoniella acicularis]